MTAAFNPNSAAEEGSGIFGLPFKEEDAALVYLPVPWEATVSYGGGTARAPSAILEASRQVDLFDGEILKPYEPGLFCLPESKTIQALNKKARTKAQKVIAAGGISQNKSLQKSAQTVNDLSEKLNAEVYREALRLIDARKVVGVIGGDHSAPYGAIKAASEKFPGLGLLHFDAHHDLRRAYEGFTHSHASILYNVIENMPSISRVVQVGIRDYCEEESDYARSKSDLVSVFYDSEIKSALFSGEPWIGIIARMISLLPEKVWMTFDIDALDPRLCPHTGTPVPGGLDFDQAIFLIAHLAKSGRKIVGFDLNEVSPGAKAAGDEWDANVGARLLYKMSAWTLASQGLVPIRQNRR